MLWGKRPVGLHSIMKVVLAMALITACSAANAVQVILVRHNQTSSGGTISTLITDGSHMQGFPASTAVWDWDGTTLSSTGLYSPVGSLGSSIFSPTILNDNVVDLTITPGDGTPGSGSTAGTTSYTCNEGTFLSGVGANGCGNYTLGPNFIDESTTVYSGLTVSQTIGGDDVSTGAPRTISSFAFDFVSVTGTGLHTTDQVEIGNGQPLGVAGLAGELMTFQFVTTAVDDVASGAPAVAIPIPVLDNDILDDDTAAVPPGGDIVNLQVTTPPGNGTASVAGPLPGPRSGLSITYTSAPGFSGVDTFSYTVTDQSASSTATVAVTVTGNDQPVANDDGTMAAPFATVEVGKSITLDVLANDTGLSDTPLTVLSPSVMMPTFGTPTVTGSPGDATSIRIDYLAGQTPGIDAFDYQITDNSGDADTATVFVKVKGPDIPVAVDDAIRIQDGQPAFVNVLFNDTGLGATPLALTITSDPTNGRIDPNLILDCDDQPTCRVWYEPDAGFSGTDTYQYMVTDNNGLNSNAATVTITVDELPVAVDDTASTQENTPTAPIDVLANDTGLSFVPLTVEITTAPVNGTAVVMPDNTIVYTPTPGAGAKTDKFDYTVTDNNLKPPENTGNSSSATVAVSITLSQTGLPGKSSALGPVSLGLLLLLPWLRRRRD